MKKIYVAGWTLFALVALALGLSFLTTSAPAQQWAKDRLGKSPRHQEWVDVKAGGRTIHCFVVYPEAKVNTPAVLVVHEIYGASDWAQNLCDELAAAGYIAICPDLVSGKGPKGEAGGTPDYASPNDVTRIVTSLKPAEVEEDLNAAADYIENKDKVPSFNGTLAVAGFCWGGAESFRFATYRPDVKAAYSFYGPTNALTTATLSKIPCPVYGFYGGTDNRVTSMVPRITGLMKAVGKTYEPVIYQGAGHGFMRGGEDPTTTNATHAADVKAHDEAWTRWKELLGKLTRK